MTATDKPTKAEYGPVLDSPGRHKRSDAPLGPSGRWRVTLADGFACYEGYEGRAYEIAAKHDGAEVKQVG